MTIPKPIDSIADQGPKRHGLIVQSKPQSRADVVNVALSRIGEFCSLGTVFIRKTVTTSEGVAVHRRRLVVLLALSSVLLVVSNIDPGDLRQGVGSAFAGFIPDANSAGQPLAVLGPFNIFLPLIRNDLPPAPPAPKFQYGVTSPWCEHAGGSYIKGRVYDSTSSDANGVAGILVALGDSSGTNPWVVVPSFDDGYYSFTLTPDGGGAKTGTYYLWLMDGSGNRISDLGGPIVINGLPADAPGSCWAGGVDFWRRKVSIGLPCGPGTRRDL